MVKRKDFNPFLFPSADPDYSNPSISSSSSSSSPSLSLPSTLPPHSQSSASLNSPLNSSPLAPSPSYSSVAPSSGSAVARGPCATCKLLGRQCTDECSTSTYPLDESELLTIVDRLFGDQASTIINFIKEQKDIVNELTIGKELASQQRHHRNSPGRHQILVATGAEAGGANGEETENISKLNWVLQERVKSLCMENQIWRDLARTNEATAEALRSYLEQFLATQVKEERTRGAAAEMDDEQSCCGNSDEGERCTLASGGVEDRETRISSRVCKRCWKEEACVLLLPCRHLCLCTVCGSSLHTCPICEATVNASVVVKMS